MPILRALLCAAMAAPLLPAQDRKACVASCMTAWNDAARACVERYPAGGAGLDACLHAALSERNRCLAACPETRAWMIAEPWAIPSWGPGSARAFPEGFALGRALVHAPLGGPGPSLADVY